MKRLSPLNKDLKLGQVADGDQHAQIPLYLWRLCRSIIEEQSGRIWMENNPQGGTTFFFTLNSNSGEIQ